MALTQPDVATGSVSESVSLEELVLALKATVARHEVQLARLLSARGAYAASDVRLLIAIHEASAGLPFRASHIMRRAEAVPALQAALAGAMIDTAQELGKTFARLEGVNVDGVRLEKVKLIRGGWLWRTVRTDHRCDDDA